MSSSTIPTIVLEVKETKQDIQEEFPIIFDPIPHFINSAIYSYCFNGVIIINSTGLFLVSFFVKGATVNTTIFSFAIKHNSEIKETYFATELGNQLKGSAMLQVNSGDQVSIVNLTEQGAVVRLAPNGTVDAQITIQQI